MNVELSPKVKKYIIKLDKITRDRFIKALDDLSKEPPKGDIKSLAGRNGYRLRVGDYRALFDIEDNKIIVHNIGLRGQIYKKRR